MFSSHSGQDGVLLADIMDEKTRDLTGREDPMFVDCMSPAISLRILVRSISAYLEEISLSWLDL